MELVRIRTPSLAQVSTGTAAIAAAFSAVTYELCLATYAASLIGATIQQFALVIGVMMASMGVGAYASSWVPQRWVPAFVGVNLGLAALSLFALPLLYICFARALYPTAVLIGLGSAFGFGLGMEIPLLSRERTMGFAQLLFLDYVGGFIAGVLFPFFLLPYLGFFRLSAALGLLNSLIALSLCFIHREQTRPLTGILFTATAVLSFVSLINLLLSPTLQHKLEVAFFRFVS